MKAAHEAEEANADEGEGLSESENEPTEEYSYEGDPDEHSYGGEAEEGDESTDYSLYEPPSDDDSD